MLKAAIEKRKIEHVWHFTRLENLDSILKNGLIPRANLEAQSVSTLFNDCYRLDGERNANCLSIGHPNYKMFWGLRQDNPQQEWVVIACIPSILWLKDCAFCYENAASSKVTTIPLVNRKDVSAFENLFSPAEGKPSRAELNLPDTCPTNPQAEILVFGTIEPQYIIGAVCQSKSRSDELKAKYPSFQFVYHKALFSARVDYAHWK